MGKLIYGDITGLCCAINEVANASSDVIDTNLRYPLCGVLRAIGEFAVYWPTFTLLGSSKVSPGRYQCGFGMIP